jgi:class 3 adenylate cyclase/tetratricopeptide (TPR) repeat protein
MSHASVEGIALEVKEWLTELGLGQYAEAFAANHIDAELLDGLTADDLRDLGVTSLGHRKRLLAAIAERKAGTTAQAARPEPSANSGERREVTILFCDLSGFTALSKALDPEELHELVSRYTRLIDGIVEGYGGSVDKHIGDAVMALFGAPIAHHDDPLRAARAALDIHAAVAGLSSEFGRPLEAHLGIASGEVIAAGIARAGQQDYTVLGDAVNLAARLVGMAQPGETVISDAVSRALFGRANCEACGTVVVKGLEIPERLWKLRDLAGDGAAAHTPFVDRHTELEQFRGILAACMAGGRGQVVYIRGDAGIGKTRLMSEMAQLAELQGFARHQGLVLDFGAGKGQDPVRGIVRSLIGIPLGGGDGQARRVAAERAAAESLVRADQTVFLNDLLDLPQSAAMQAQYDAMDNAGRNRGKWELIADLVHAASRSGPLLITIEDLQWADSVTLAFTAAIARAVTTGPVILVLTSRLDGDPLNRAWRAGIGGASLTTVDLAPLGKQDALSLAGAFIDASQRVALACVERAEGNPLFLEQLLRNAEEGADEAIPASIRSLVLARMDRLSASDKRALQAASIMGQRFDLATLRHLLQAAEYRCDGLIRNALVRPDAEAYLFAHALVQESVYSSLLKARRRELHRNAAEWFVESDPVLRAQHLDRAEDPGAPLAYCEAAQAQRASYHYERALQLVERGLAIADVDRDRHKLLCLKGELLLDLGLISEAIEAFRAALGSAVDDVGRCRAWIGVAAGLRISEGLDEALELLDKAQEVADRRDLVFELARLHHLRGNILYPLGRIDACRRQHELSLRHAQRSGSLEEQARALGGLGDAAFAGGRMRTGFEYFSRCLALSRQNGFGRIEVSNHSMLGHCRLYLNELAQALQDGLAAADAAARAGDARAELTSETLGIWGCYEIGQYDRALQHLDRADQLAKRLGARRFEAQNREFEGRILFAMGRRDEAIARLRDALEICRTVGLYFVGPRAVAGLALATPDPEERYRLLEEGEALLQQGGYNPLWFYRDAIEAMLMAHDWQGALRYAATLDECTRTERLPWSDLFVTRARALVAVAQDGTNISVPQLLDTVLRHLDSAGLKPYRMLVETALREASRAS